MRLIALGKAAAGTAVALFLIFYVMPRLVHG